MRFLRTIFFVLITNLTGTAIAQIVAEDDLLRQEVSGFGQVRVSVVKPGRDMLNVLFANVSVTSVRDNRVAIILSPLTIEWFILQDYDYEILKRTDYKSITSARNIKEALEWESYPSYTQYDSIMRSFTELYPSLCDLDTIGTSINGKLVLALKISDHATTDEDEPEALYTSSMHGDETGGFILMLRLADWLLKNYNSNGRVTNLVDNLEIWINPLANPDGTYRSGNVITSPTRFNAYGYDLNRNFPDPDASGTPPQKETLDMIRFMRNRNFVISANFHSGEEVVNYPWDRWFRLHADDDWFYNISRKYADTVHQWSVPGYMTSFDNGITNGYDWYKVNGGRQDFMTWELQGREVTIEVDDSYVAPPSTLNSLWNYNWRSLLGYLENALYGIHGKVRDALTGEPVPARIFIKNHDKDSSHIYADTVSGSFVRLLAPGTWDITFTAKGYIDKPVNDLLVEENKKTGLVVEMIPVTSPVDTMDTAIPVLYPNPATEYLKVVLPDHLIGMVNFSVYNSAGKKLIDFDTETYKDTPVYLDVKRFSAGVYTLIIMCERTDLRNTERFVVIRR